jgi:hypothetical protein
MHGTRMSGTITQMPLDALVTGDIGSEDKK